MSYVINILKKKEFQEFCILDRNDHSRVFHFFILPELNSWTVYVLHGVPLSDSERTIHSSDQLQRLITEFTKQNVTLFHVKGKKQERYVKKLFGDKALVFRWDTAFLTPGISRCDFHLIPRFMEKECAFEKCFSLKLWINSINFSNDFVKTVTPVTYTDTESTVYGFR
jgi:hypothetical protein